MRIDWWTLALQTINVLILIWLLARFFFRPVMDIVSKRQEEADKLLADADHARKEAADVLATADEARAEIATRREALIAEARNEAQAEKQNLIAQSTEEIARRHAAAEAAIARDRAAAEQAIIDHAIELSIDVTRRLLARFQQRDVLPGFVDEICREVRAFSPEERTSFVAATAADHPLEIVTAGPLSGEEMQYVRTALEEAFNAGLPLAFRSDPRIIAGIELKGQNAIIRNNWRADLDRIRQELGRGKHVRQP